MKTHLPIICFLFSSLCFSSLSAQNTFVSLGGEIALPGSSSGLEKEAGTGFGGSVRVESSWSKHISGTLGLGYLVFEEATSSYNASTKSKVKALVFLAGIKYYPKVQTTTPVGFFVSAEIGFINANRRFTFEANPPSSSNEMGLACAIPGVGYQLKKWKLLFAPNLT